MSLGQAFNLDDILRKFDISNLYIDNSDLTEKILEKIFDDYIKIQTKITKAYEKEWVRLSSGLEFAHSIRGRIKDPEHLIAKIIRNVSEKPDKYKNINVENYYKIITDLIGFRIILLNKNDWKKIHDFLTSSYENKPEKYLNPKKLYEDQYEKKVDKGFFAEQPVIYVTRNDEHGDYSKSEIAVVDSKLQYRSVHYIVREETFYFEIQVRTLFEEGWLEFDHRILYPNDKGNQIKKEYVGILNDLAHAADSIISFYDRYEDILPTSTVDTVDSKSSEQKAIDISEDDGTIESYMLNLN